MYYFYCVRFKMITTFRLNGLVSILNNLRANVRHRIIWCRLNWLKFIVSSTVENMRGLLLPSLFLKQYIRSILNRISLYQQVNVVQYDSTSLTQPMKVFISIFLWDISIYEYNRVESAVPHSIWVTMLPNSIHPFFHIMKVWNSSQFKLLLLI